MVLSKWRGKSAATGDYINASLVSSQAGPYSYIAAQGPLQETIHDFIQMLTQARISTVVTACQDVEDGMEKCFKYWTDSADGKWHSPVPDFAVKLKAKQQFEGFVVRDLLFKSSMVLPDHESHEVRQFHLMDWPDHGVPESAGPIMDLLDGVYKHMNRVGKRDSAGEVTWKLLVHCSAGCGRTGTLIAIDQISQLLKEKKLASGFMFDVARANREQRVNMIETCVS